MIIILSLLFVSFGVLTTGKENCCLQAGSICKLVTCEDLPVVEIKSGVAGDAISAASVDEIYQPLSPVGYFILL